ncbi:MAG: TIM barrel protein [Hyphomicrobiales bacterium]|nr:TIM barrel protein [Hyphomicrobiales bacterium]
MLKRALNHMAAPNLDWAAFLELAASLDCVGVEFRNDLEGDLFNGAAPEDVGAAATSAGLRILALAEVKAFNDWSDDKRGEAAALAKIAKTCGAEMVSLIARNDGKGIGDGERQADLRVALRELGPLLEEHGLIGLIEPLGFEICALRDKGEVVDAIEDLGVKDRFRIVHDTFHHTLAGGGPIYPDYTGIVHVSGVVDPAPSVSEMRDPDRVLVDDEDRLGNVSQVSELMAAGYNGPVSFEPFAVAVHDLKDPYAAYARSFQFIEAGVGRAGAG